jgi:hypothetical protein
MEGVEGKLHSLLTSALRESEWLIYLEEKQKLVRNEFVGGWASKLV